MTQAKIALRNLNRQKKRSSTLAIAIGFGVFVVLIINSFLAGSIRNIKENVADLVGGHIFITTEHQLDNRVARYVDDDKALIEALTSFGIKPESLQKSITSDFNSKITFGSKSDDKWFIGVDFEHDKKTVENLGLSAKALDEIKNDPNSLVINLKTAKDLKLQIGDTVLASMKTYSGQDDVFELNIRGILDDESENTKTYGWMHSERLRQALNLPGKNSYSSLIIRLDSVDSISIIQLMIQEGLKLKFPVKENNRFAFSSPIQKIDGVKENFEGNRLEITSINDYLSNLDAFAQGLMAVSFFFLIFVMFIIIVGIWNTFKMIFYERIVEIGTLRAVGMQRNQVRSMILFEATFLSILGFFVGLVFAIVVSMIVSAVSFPSEGGASIFLNKGHLNFRFEIPTMISIIILIVGATLLAATGPARRAAKLSPAAALRTTN